MLALSRLVKEHEDVTLVCIGPLTNVAIAYKLDPKFAKRLKKLVILGGNYLGKVDRKIGSILVPKRLP